LGFTGILGIAVLVMVVASLEAASPALAITADDCTTALLHRLPPRATEPQLSVMDDGSAEPSSVSA
jgi:hypothetical protein